GCQQLLCPDSQSQSSVVTSFQSRQNCSGCGEEIRERYFLQTGDSGFWHAECLRCAACQTPLAHEVTCYCKHGLVYCKQDYARIFKCGTCARCGQKIDTNELVMRVPGLVFHLDCFACATCSRRLRTGELFGLQEGIVYCRDDYEILLQTLRHRRLSEASSTSFCAQAPAFYNGTGAVQKGRPRKKRIDEVACEFKRFGIRGCSCVQFCVLMVSKNQGLHCGSVQFRVLLVSKNQGLHCGSVRFRVLLVSKNQGLHCGSVQFRVLLVSKNQGLHCGSVQFLEDFDHRSEEYSLNSPPRQKRMRTSFKHHQIRTMKAYFGLNHNPDAKDLKQLAEKTGLSKRVL
uniref:LIM/homeobox protein Lhx9 n=1 Tax=Macrostomum lignano TaxID=282301 RepID=A0A1I8JN83_9PLAT